MRPASWRRYTPGAAAQAPHDAAPALLLRLANDVESGCAAALRVQCRIFAGVPERRQSVLRSEGPVQWWLSDIGDGLDAAFALTAQDARGLLEILLGGPPAPAPTSLELRIVRESVDRLLSSTGRLWEERAAEPWQERECWSVRIDIAGPGASSGFSFRSPAMIEPEAAPPALVELNRIPIVVSAQLPPQPIAVAALGGLEAGDLFRLGVRQGTEVRLMAQGVEIASGRLGCAQGRRSVEIDRIAGAVDR